MYILEIYTPYKKIEQKFYTYRNASKAYIKCELKIEEYRRRRPDIEHKCGCRLHPVKNETDDYNVFEDFKLFSHLYDVRKRYSQFCKNNKNTSQL